MMQRGPQPTSLVAAARPGFMDWKLPEPVRVLRVDDDDMQVALGRSASLALLGLTPAVAGIYVGHPWRRGSS